MHYFTQNIGDFASFIFVPKNGVYYLENTTENSAEWQATNDYRKITLDGSTKCYVLGEHDEETTVSKNFKDFSTQKVDPINHHPWLYSFKFKNGKCISITFFATGH